MNENTILVVDGDEETIELLKYLLGTKYIVKTAYNGISAYCTYKEYSPFLIISDINIPYMDGIELITKIREYDLNTKVIFLSADANISYLLDAAKLKLSYYLLKPVDNQKLFKQVALARSEYLNYSVKSTKNLIISSEYMWSFDNMELYKNSRAVTLTLKEAQIFQILLENNNNSVSYEELFYNTWDSNIDNVNKKNLKVLISGLRKKLPKGLISNVYGVGYKVNI